MRWKPLSARTQLAISAPIWLPFAIVYSPILLWVWLAERDYQKYRTYRPWYAWRPVLVVDYDPWRRSYVWLETVEKKVDPLWGASYRTPAGSKTETGIAP